MTMLIVEDLKGNQQPLIVSALHVTKQLNTLSQIEFTTVNTADNQTAYDMIQPRSIFIDPVDGEIYRISQKSSSELGDYFQTQVTALQALTDLSDHYVKDVLYNTQTLDAVMQHITRGTKFTYKLHGSFGKHDFGSKGGESASPFGNGLAYDLFINSIVKDYNVEWSCNGYQIDLYNQIGSENQFVCIDKDDIFKLQESADFTTLKTRIYGTGKNDDNGTPIVSTTYTSPNAEKFGYIDASPYSDERCTNIDTLIKELKNQLQDYPLVQYQANINTLKKYSNALNNNYSIGNYGTVLSRWGVDITTRISKLDIYRDSPTNNSIVTFGNLQLDPATIISKMNQAHNNLVNDVNKVISDNQASVGSSELIEITNGTINVSSSGGIVYVDFSLSEIDTGVVLTTLNSSYRPKQDRSNSVIVSADKNYILNITIHTTGEFEITSISDLSGTSVEQIESSVNGNFNYII